MAHLYDTSTNVFSRDGRLRQIEYAMEAVAAAGTCIGISAKDGVLLVAERRKINKLLDETMHLEKIYKIDDAMVCAVSGMISDGNVLLQEMRMIGQRHFKRYGEPIPCEQLVSVLCDVKQAYTQFGGKRPFGVSILYMGWDKHNGFQLYRSDPCGNYFGWNAICMGRNSEAIMSLLQKEYHESEITLRDAQSLALKCLSISFAEQKLCPAKVEMASLTREFQLTKVHILNTAEIKAAIEVFEQQRPEP